MPNRYVFRGDTAKSLGHTTPPYEALQPGDVFEVEESLDGPEFDASKAKPTRGSAQVQDAAAIADSPAPPEA